MRRSYRKLYIKVFIFVCLILFLLNLYLLKFSRKSHYVTDLLYTSDKSPVPTGNGTNYEKYYTGFIPKIQVKNGLEQESIIAADEAMQKSALSEYDVIEFIQKNPSMLSEYGFNVELSKNLFYIRHLPDFRHDECLQEFENLNKLPTASVVIVFHNVPLSLLLRTLHSTLRRSPEELKEIVLVDDFSTNLELGSKLDYYIETRLASKVKLKRSRSRLGNQKARLLGANYTSSDILIFMDVHSEPNIGWLEPILYRIKESPTSVVLPILNEIDPIYLKHREIDAHVGGFSWNGKYHKEPISEREWYRRESDCTQQDVTTCVIQTPTMPPRATYAISRTLYDSFSFLDTQLVTSGGDTLEISFAIWMCGGQIEIAVCSRVGLIQMDPSYKYAYNTTEYEIGRIATSWWDDKAHYLFFFRPNMQPNEFVLTGVNRQNIRNFLNCKDFNWYLRNVYPEKMVPTNLIIKYGLLRHMTSSICLRDQLLVVEQPVISVQLVYCDEITQISDYFFYTKEQTLQSEFNCLIVDINGDFPLYMVELVPCIDINPIYYYKWKLKRNKFILVNTSLCLDVIHMGFKQDFPVVRECQQEAETQQWEFAKFKKIITHFTTSTAKPTNTTIDERMNILQSTNTTIDKRMDILKPTVKTIDKRINTVKPKPKKVIHNKKPAKVKLTNVKKVKEKKVNKPAKRKIIKKPSNQTQTNSKSKTKPKYITTVGRKDKKKPTAKTIKSKKNQKTRHVNPKKQNKKKDKKKVITKKSKLTIVKSDKNVTNIKDNEKTSKNQLNVTKAN